MSDFPGLAGLAAKLASGEVSAIGLAQSFLDRVDGSPKTFITVDPDGLLREAHASDRRRRDGALLSPHDGLLFAVKDNIDVAGFRTTNGSKTRLAAPPAGADAAIVESLRQAGLIVAGKSNLSEFAFSGLGLNPYFGTPGRHRFQPPRAPGGSSSGSAVAVADALVPLALGTDTAGSLRVPPAFTGMVGFRATTGRYPMRGVVPLAPSFDALGAITRRVDDMIAFDAITSGSPEAPPRSGRPIEIVIDEQFLRSCGMTDEVETGIDGALQRLRRLGARLNFRRVAQVSRTLDLIARHGWPGSFEAHRQFARLLESGERGNLDPRVAARLDLGGRMDPDSVNATMTGRATAISAFEAELGDAVVMVPTVTHVPPILDLLEVDSGFFSEINLETLRLTMIGSYLDAPTVALPAGETPAGLPVSLSLLAPRGRDLRVLAAAAVVEGHLTGDRSVPRHSPAMS